MDLRIKEECFKGKTDPGFFIEVGANDGVRQSNTKYFEDNWGWKGILIEPIPALYEACKKNRSKENIVENYALVSNDYKGKTIEIYDTYDCHGLMSVIADTDYTQDRLAKERSGKYNKIKVPAIQLDKILEKHKKKIPAVIDLMVLDVETYEMEVLKGINFDKWRIEWLVAEELDDTNEELRNYLRQYYHVMIKLSEKDVLFWRK